MFSGYLNSINVKHLMFDMCNNFDEKLLYNKQTMQIRKGLTKIDLIKNNDNVLDIWSFVGNKFMYNLLPEQERLNIDEYSHHHKQEEYVKLEDFLVKHIQKVNLRRHNVK